MINILCTCNSQRSRGIIKILGEEKKGEEEKGEEQEVTVGGKRLQDYAPLRVIIVTARNARTVLNL